MLYLGNPKDERTRQSVHKLDSCRNLVIYIYLLQSMYFTGAIGGVLEKAQYVDTSFYV